MVWLIIACIVIYFVIKKMNEQQEENKVIEPPTEDALFMGCTKDCGYYTPEFYKDSNGEWEMVKDKGYCGYQKGQVVWGSPCLFAKEHPELLRKSLFDDIE